MGASGKVRKKIDYSTFQEKEKEKSHITS